MENPDLRMQQDHALMDCLVVGVRTDQAYHFFRDGFDVRLIENEKKSVSYSLYVGFQTFHNFF
jgi:CTP:phosphocholine cytidylyltransferase-like protein